MKINIETTERDDGRVRAIPTRARAWGEGRYWLVLHGKQVKSVHSQLGVEEVVVRGGMVYAKPPWF